VIQINSYSDYMVRVPPMPELDAALRALNDKYGPYRRLSGEMFRAYVEQMLAPALRPGDVVVLDNLPAHKVAGIEAAIRAAGASLMPLPPYSPDLNPIEQLFAKLKSLLRKAATRTRDALWSTIGHLLDEFTPDECRRYIANSGYEVV